MKKKSSFSCRCLKNRNVKHLAYHIMAQAYPMPASLYCFISFLGCGLFFLLFFFCFWWKKREKTNETLLEHKYMTGNAESAGVFKFIVYDFKWWWWWWWSLYVITKDHTTQIHELYLTVINQWTLIFGRCSVFVIFRNCLCVCGTGVYFHFI